MSSQAKIPIVFVLKDAALKKAEKGLSHLEKRSHEFVKTLGGLTLGVGIEEFARKSVEAAVKMEAATTKLNTSLRNIGQASAIGSESIKKTNEQMANLGFVGSDAAQALATLVTATGSLDKAQFLMGKTADIARFKHISLEEASIKLAKASAGNAKAFREFGITMDKTLKPADAFNKAMLELDDKIRNQAQAYAETYAGKLEILKAKFEEIQVQVGDQLLPVLVKLGNWLIKTGIPKTQSFFTFLADNKDTVLGLAAALGTLALAFKSIAVYAGLANTAALPLLAAALPFVAAIAGIAGITALIASSPVAKTQTAAQRSAAMGGGGNAKAGASAFASTQAQANKPAPDKWQGVAMGRDPQVIKNLREQARIQAALLAAQKAAARQKALELANKKLAAQFDMNQIQLAAALKNATTQEQIDKIKALQSLEDDGQKTEMQRLEDQANALKNLLALKEQYASTPWNVNTTSAAGNAASTATTGTLVNAGGGELAGGQTIPSPSTMMIPKSVEPLTVVPTSSIAPTVSTLAATNAGGGERAGGAASTAAPVVNVTVQGSVIQEQELLNTIFNGLGNKLKAGATWYNNAAAGI
jgi:hypothetical protein